jgi:hypothetical protein
VDRDELGSLRESIAYYYDQVAPLLTQGYMTLYRALVLPEDRPWRDALRLDRMGISWTFSREDARVYHAEDGESFSQEDALDGVVVEAVVEASAVNWETSMIHLSLYDEEREVRLLADRPLTITAVGDERLDPPLRANTGQVTQRWHQGL